MTFPHLWTGTRSYSQKVQNLISPLASSNYKIRYKLPLALANLNSSTDNSFKHIATCKNLLGQYIFKNINETWYKNYEALHVKSNVNERK